MARFTFTERKPTSAAVRSVANPEMYRHCPDTRRPSPFHFIPLHFGTAPQHRDSTRQCSQRVSTVVRQCSSPFTSHCAQLIVDRVHMTHHPPLQQRRSITAERWLVQRSSDAVVELSPTQIGHARPDKSVCPNGNNSRCRCIVDRFPLYRESVRGSRIESAASIAISAALLIGKSSGVVSKDRSRHIQLWCDIEDRSDATGSKPDQDSSQHPSPGPYSDRRSGEAKLGRSSDEARDGAVLTASSVASPLSGWVHFLQQRLPTRPHRLQRRSRRRTPRRHRDQTEMDRPALFLPSLSRFLPLQI